MRVLVLDSHLLFSVGIKHFLEAQWPGVTAEPISCSRRALARAREGDYALVLMELAIGGADGMRVLKRLRAESPRVPILVLSDWPIHYYGPRTIHNGAAGFVEKDCEPAQLLHAVNTALAGERYLSPRLAERILDGQTSGTGNPPPHETLSVREFQVFRELALGQPLTAIAKALHISVKTVDSHRTRILRKLGVATRAELARYAFEHELIPSRRHTDQARGSS